MTKRLARTTLAAALLAGMSATNASLDVPGFAKDVDPCSDFYAYVNRTWMQRTEIPADRATWGTGTMLSQRNEQLIRETLEAAIKSPPPEGSAKRKVVDYYASGLDRDGIERTGVKPLQPFMASIATVKDARSLAATLAFLHSAGINPGFAFGVTQDAKQSTRYVAEIVQGGLGMPERDYYFKDDARSQEQREAYKRHVAAMLVLAGDDAAAAAKSADTIFALESELAKASMTAVERRDDEKTYNLTKLDALAAQAPGFPWRAYFDALGAKNLAELNIGQPLFMKRFAELAGERPAAEWRTYLRWHLLKATASKLPKAFEDEAFAFNDGVLNGLKSAPERHRKLLIIINGPYGSEPMAQALGQLYVERAFPPESKARADAIITNVKAALGDRLRDLDWMSPTTRQRALEKLDAIAVKIGYPDKWRDYSSANVGKAPFVQNWIEANRFEHRRELAKLGKPVDRGDWWMAPQMVNAYYNPSLNEIVFPAAILQPPMFDAKADDALNYGGIGMVIGHEITHGFDDGGRKFDAQGNMRDWWTAEDASRYVARAKLVEQQYNAYEGVDGLKVNGALTLGENISDVGGLKIAYLAHQKALQKSNPGKIDGLTPEQRFFLAYAQSWRRLDRPERERLIIQTDGHSPARFRVKGPIVNMPEFAKAFSCDPDKALRAQSERVNIW